MKFQGTYMRATILLVVTDLLSDHAIDIADVLPEVGIDPACISDVDRLISFKSVCALFELVARKLNKPMLGIEITRLGSPDFASNGPLILIANFVEDLQAFILAGIKYQQIHSNGMLFNHEIDQKSGLYVLTVNIDPFAFPARQITEGTVATVWEIVRVVTSRPDLNPSLVRFQHSAPRSENDKKIIDSFFRCPVEYGCQHNQIHMELAYTKLKTKGRLKVFFPLVQHYMNMRLNKLVNKNVKTHDSVSLALSSVIGSNNCNIDFIASTLNTTPKTLQRQLSFEGTSFSEILEGVRFKLAQQMLSETAAPVGTIAELLDYSTTAPFTTAFQRMSGMTPLKFRKKHQKIALEE